jgi:hypothetical protein
MVLLCVIMLNVVMLRDIILLAALYLFLCSHFAEAHYVECHYAECCGPKVPVGQIVLDQKSRNGKWFKILKVITIVNLCKSKEWNSVL